MISTARAFSPNDSRLMRLVLVALLIAFPFVASQFGNSWVRIIDVALLYIMLALGLNIVVGFAGLLDLGYIAFLPSALISPDCLLRLSLSSCSSRCRWNFPQLLII